MNKTADDFEKTAQDFLSYIDREESLRKLIQFFPYPIHVYSADGTSVMMNQAFIQEFGISAPEAIIGNFNIIKDNMLDIVGIRKDAEKAFSGQTIILTDTKVPVKYIALNIPGNMYTSYNVDILYQDVTAFPVLDENGKVIYVIVMMISRRVFKEREEIIKAKEYIENNYKDKFDLSKSAEAAGFSTSYFSRLFTKHVGISPHDYCVKCKIDHVKIKLHDKNLSVAQAFSECGMDYNGNFANSFKKFTGLSPSKYRALFCQKS